MRIAILSYNYLPLMGGAEVFVIKLADYLLKKGHDVDIITLKHNSEFSDFEVINGVKVYRGQFFKGKPGLSFFSSIWSLLNLLRKNDKKRSYDVIHSVGEAPTSQAGAIFKKLRKKPHLITIQGGYIARREYLKKNNNFSVKDKLFEKMISASFKGCNSLHAISNVISRESRELGAKNVKIIPNGVDEEMIRVGLKNKIRSEQNISQNSNVIISISRLTPRKGFNNVIMGFATFVEKNPDSQLIIVGDGIQRNELEKLVRDTKIENKVCFKGMIPHNEIVSILPAADVFALTPIYEGLGIVYIESLACEVPVITTEVGGIPDIVKNYENGIFVKYGDPKELSEALEKILNNKELHLKLRNEGIKTVQQKFIWENIFLEIEEIYKSIV